MKSPGESMIGRMLGQYRVVEEIAHGGMGVVYRAADEKLRRDVALKVLPDEATRGHAVRESFASEARALSRISHPNVETVFDFGTVDGVDFLVTEFVRGTTLADLLARGQMEEAEQISIAAQIARALHCAHSQGVIHGDVKPSNVMMTPEGQVKLVDFGLARLLPSFVTSQDPTQSADVGVLRGTLPYMAPELILGARANVTSDIYSLGVLLYEMATGTRPFESSPATERMTQISRGAPPPRSRNPAISPALERVILTCLAAHPRDRFASAADLGRAIEQAGSRSGIPRRWPIRLAWATLGLLLVVLALWPLFRPHPRAPRRVANRVAIVPLRNLTGDPALDPIGQMAADWMNRGLLTTGFVDVVPTAEVFVVVGSPRSPAIPPPTDTARWLGDESGASIVVTGSYYRNRDTLLADVVINDAAHNRVVMALEPVRIPISAPLAGLETLRQRLMAGLGSLTHPRLASYAHLVSQPPSYAAYLDYVRGEEHFSRQEWEAAVLHYSRAAHNDTTFVSALLAECMARLNLGQAVIIDSLTRRIQPSRSRLAPLDRCVLDWLGAWLEGDLRRGAELASEAAALAPASKWAYQSGLQALLLGRAGEARRILETLDPDRGSLRGWIPYWETLTAACHLLGDHRRELAVARQAAKRHPRTIEIRLMQARARAALNDRSGLRALIDAGRSDSDSSRAAYAALAIQATRELRAHRHEKAAHELAVATLAETHNAPIPAGQRGALLYLASEWDEARRVYEGLLDGDDQNPHTLGYLGAIAARRGDADAARDYLQRLDGIEGRFLRGAVEYWQADITALLGDREAAVSYLRKSFQQGHAIAFSVHSDPDLESIRKDPAVAALTK